MPSTSLIIIIVSLQVIAIVKPIAAQNCTGCTIPTAGGTAYLPSHAVLVNTTITNNTSPITGCATVTFVCPEGSLVQIVYNGGAPPNPQRYDLMEHTFECGTSGGFGFVYYYFNVDNSDGLNDIRNIISIQCYTIPCTSPICPLSLIQFNVGNPNPCDQSMVVTNTYTLAENGCIDILVYCQHPSFTLYEVLVDGSVQNVTAYNNFDVLYCDSSPSGFFSDETYGFVSQVYCSNPNAPTKCGLVPAPAACPAPVACYQCVAPCANLNYPGTDISKQINPQLTFLNGQPYTSAIYQNGLDECGNRQYTTAFESANSTSVITNLNNGYFIGVFTCPFAMCVCTDPTNGTLDCFRGSSSVQILLFPVNTTIFGLVMNSVIYTPAQKWYPPSNISNLPPLMKPYYIKINHLACVASLTAPCPIAAT